MSESGAKEPNEMTIAISMAKEFLAKAFEGENIENVEFEEIQPPEFGSSWKVTLGFNRRVDFSNGKFTNSTLSNSFLQAAAAATIRPRRIYKVVDVDITRNRLTSIKNRIED